MARPLAQMPRRQAGNASATAEQAWVQVAAAEPVQSAHRPGQSSRDPVDQHILAVLTSCDACVDGQSDYDGEENEHSDDGMTTPALLPAMDSARGLTSEIAETTKGMRPERDGQPWSRPQRGASVLSQA